jgi:hypothetical protein
VCLLFVVTLSILRICRLGLSDVLIRVELCVCVHKGVHTCLRVSVSALCDMKK